MDLEQETTMTIGTPTAAPWTPVEQLRDRRRGSTETSLLPRRLAGVSYEVRGRLHDHAVRMEAAGRPVLKLNIGNPGAFGFRAPEAVVAKVAARLDEAQAYAPSRGLATACSAVARYAHAKGVPVRGEEDVYLGNGVSDLILMTLQSLLDAGDE